jgi:predicted esterase
MEPRAARTVARDDLVKGTGDDPHRGQPVLHRGPQPAAARLTLILVHGRGASAEDVLSLAGEFATTDVAYLAPQAAGHTWYPYSFLSPIPDNEPGIRSGLGVIAGIIDGLAAQQISPERIGLLGFSQGACLSLEFAARHARRYAAIVGLSGGLIGPPGTPRDYAGSLDGTPVFLGCSDIDAHIPLERVRESAEVCRRLGAAVDERIYPRMGHTVNPDEIAAVHALLLSPDRHGSDT